MEMASWFQVPEGFLYLLDEDVIAWHDARGTEAINWHDMVGHGGLVRVFGIPDDKPHLEGFVDMPVVIRKSILDEKMDMLFAHAGNLSEATPEFIPTMKRLANRWPEVEAQLKRNPYINCKDTKIQLSIFDQMKVGVESGFSGSTIGQLIRHNACQEDSFLCALKGAKDYMDKHSDHHHYHEMIRHQNITKKVLNYIMDNVKHQDVVNAAKTRLSTVGANAIITKVKSIKKVKVQTSNYKVGKAKIRVAL